MSSIKNKALYKVDIITKSSDKKIYSKDSPKID